VNIREDSREKEAVTEVNSVTSNGLGCADPPAGLRRLFALLRRRAWVARSIQANQTSASASLRSAT